MDLTNYLILCIFLHILGTCTYFTLPGLETFLQPAAFMGTSSMSEKMQTFSPDIPLLITAICMKGFLPVGGSCIVCSLHFFSLHLAEDHLLVCSSRLLQGFLTIPFSTHPQKLAANSLCTQINPMQMNPLSARAL